MNISWSLDPVRVHAIFIGTEGSEKSAASSHKSGEGVSKKILEEIFVKSFSVKLELRPLTLHGADRQFPSAPQTPGRPSGAETHEEETSSDYFNTKGGE